MVAEIPHRLMRHTFLRLVLASSLVAACGRGDSSKQPSAATTSETANGTVGAALADTISERADRGRIAGDENAKVWLIMASDFQCPFCKQWHDAQFAGLMQDYVQKGKVRTAFLNFPLGQHQNALPAAEAAMCAAVQNKFWPVHEALFATQHRWDTLKVATAVFDSIVTTTGINMSLYHTCVNKHLTLPMIEADRDRARQQGAQSTPTFIVVPGGTVLMGADANVRAALDAALAKVAPAKKS